MKKIELDLWASLASGEQINYLSRQIIDLRDTDKSRFFSELNTVNPLLSSPPPPLLFRGGKLIRPFSLLSPLPSILILHKQLAWTDHAVMVFFIQVG